MALKFIASRLFTFVLLWCVLALVLAVTGCRAKDSLGQGQRFIGEVRGDAQGIRDDADALKPHVDDAGQPILAKIRDKSERIVTNTDEASKVLSEASRERDKDKKKGSEADGSVLYQLSRSLSWLVKLIPAGALVTVVLLVVAEGFGRASSGPWGFFVRAGKRLLGRK